MVDTARILPRGGWSDYMTRRIQTGSLLFFYFFFYFFGCREAFLFSIRYLTSLAGDSQVLAHRWRIDKVGDTKCHESTSPWLATFGVKEKNERTLCRIIMLGRNVIK